MVYHPNCRSFLRGRDRAADERFSVRIGTSAGTTVSE
jgi:hypothetical protein